MHIIDSHFHWWPRSISERLCRRKGYPRAQHNERGGYTYLREQRGDYVLNSWADWFDLDYRWKDWLGLRAGRVKLPYGLYNDTSDIDAARVLTGLSSGEPARHATARPPHD